MHLGDRVGYYIWTLRDGGVCFTECSSIQSAKREILQKYPQLEHVSSNRIHIYNERGIMIATVEVGSKGKNYSVGVFTSGGLSYHP